MSDLEVQQVFQGLYHTKTYLLHYQQQPVMHLTAYIHLDAQSYVHNETECPH